MLDMCSLAGERGKDIYFVRSQDGRCMSAAIDFVAKYTGKPQSDFPYEQISNWDGVQNRLLLILHKASYYDPQKDYTEIFNTYCKQEQMSLMSLIEY